MIVVPFTAEEPPEELRGSSMHNWQKPWYSHNIFNYFCILDYEKKLVVSEVVDQIGKFFLGNSIH
jgi:hypothetical protein